MRRVFLMLLSAALAQVPFLGAEPSGPRAFTFSIVARDAATGELGVAVQSHWFSVGQVVPWAEAGIGAVATQSIAEPSYGPLGLELMRSGKTPQQALNALLAADTAPDVRQVAMVDATGRVAVHTGSKCIPAAGHAKGEGFCVQANLMEKESVWPAMEKAFREAKGDLADRMLAALDAAQGEGGDIRGMQSAALLVVRGKPSGKPWADRLFDLRVEDSEEPVRELRRLVSLQRAYNHASAGDDRMAENRVEEALAEYAEAAKLAPQVLELPFWQAVTMASTGRVELALPIFREVFARQPRWAELVKRLPGVGMLPDDGGLMARILAEAGKK